MSWYANWFDTEYYHQLYQHRDDDEAGLFVKAISEKYPPSKFPFLCDAACGKGRHAISFNEQGFKVDAFDLSENSIAEAQKTKKDNLRFFVHDILENFGNEKYDLITNLFTSFGYFETEIHDVHALTFISEALKWDGIFIQDYLNARMVKPDVKWHQTKRGNLTFRTKKTISGDKVIKDIEVLDNGEKHTFQEQVKLYTFEHFKKFYEMSGLELLETFGDYQFNPFDEGDSKRLILVGRKAR